MLRCKGNGWDTAFPLSRVVDFKHAPVAQLDRASGYEPEGRLFESARAHHKINNLLPLRPLLQKRPPLQFIERLPKLLLRVHHDRAVPGHGLLNRLARNQEEADSLLSRLYLYLIAPVEDYQ